jgi:transcriptional regulator with XRE-family HTH domain
LAVRTRADQQGLSNKVLAEQAGTTPQTLWHVMSGNRDFKVSTLLALADRLGMELVLVPKEAAPGLEGERPGAPAVKTKVQAALERISGKPAP